ncbi:MAG: hypothetical protein LQ346_000537 [Caloplaca aetnensis]|nr:MAG: hypothetical protein LQ346_000537 [Caloplaca aetnensis]
MSQPQAPRVKLPEATPPKLTLPAPNSWATKQPQPRNKTPTATRQDGYENKPMPPTPEASPSPAEKPLTARRNRGYIQPAIPLASPSPAIANMKNRAVTDPVMPKPLFASTTSTVNQLRKKYSHSRSSHKSKEGEENSTRRPASPPPALTHKASQILGVYPVKDKSRGKPPASAPPSTHTPDPFRTSSESSSGQHVSPSRQVHSTPVPTRRYLQENGMPPFPGARASQESKEAHNVLAEENESVQLRTGSDALLNPTQFATGSRKGEVEYVNKNEMQRVPSFAGIIEQPESPRVREGATEPNGLGIGWNETTLRPQYSGEILQPMVYTPSNYAGVWENDPDVVSDTPFPNEQKQALKAWPGPHTTTIQPLSPSFACRRRPARYITGLG